ncbi:MAG: hypothetical protein GX241_00745, partial [Ruminococcaceae bacterium]|nr:hypothetical protein [Oscillospiraceae bacterium]
VKSEPEEETELESELESEEVKPELEGETVETEATEEPAETTETALDSEDKDVLEDLIPGLEEINASFDKKPEEVIPLEPTVATEGTEVILTEAELQLKREIDRESGLISAEDEYADVNLDPSKIDEANINDYLEDEEKDSDKSLETVEPEVEGLSGEALPVLDEDKDETEADAMLPTAEEIDAFNAESMDIGGFINKMDPGYSEEEQAAIDRALGIGKKHTKKAKVKAEKPKNRIR